MHSVERHPTSTTAIKNFKWLRLGLKSLLTDKNRNRSFHIQISILGINAPFNFILPKNNASTGVQLKVYQDENTTIDEAKLLEQSQCFDITPDIQ